MHYASSSEGQMLSLHIGPWTTLFLCCNTMLNNQPPYQTIANYEVLIELIYLLSSFFDYDLHLSAKLGVGSCKCDGLYLLILE